MNGNREQPLSTQPQAPDINSMEQACGFQSPFTQHNTVLGSGTLRRKVEVGEGRMKISHSNPRALLVCN